MTSLTTEERYPHSPCKPAGNIHKGKDCVGLLHPRKEAQRVPISIACDGCTRTVQNKEGTRR